jgi:hypothetical protein
MTSSTNHKAREDFGRVPATVRSELRTRSGAAHIALHLVIVVQDMVQGTFSEQVLASLYLHIKELKLYELIKIEDDTHKLHSN